MNKRYDRLCPNGIPRYIRCYDNGGETYDQYTVVYTGNYNNIGKQRRSFIQLPVYQVVGMSGAPFHPQGFCQHGEYERLIDRPTYSHLGKKIRFQDLPEDCRQVVLNDYLEIWGLQSK